MCCILTHCSSSLPQTLRQTLTITIKERLPCEITYCRLKHVPQKVKSRQTNSGRVKIYEPRMTYEQHCTTHSPHLPNHRHSPYLTMCCLTIMPYNPSPGTALTAPLAGGRTAGRHHQPHTLAAEPFHCDRHHLPPPKTLLEISTN